MSSNIKLDSEDKVIGKDLKLHLGCFNKPLHGWINIDARGKPETQADLVDDAITLDKFHSNCAEKIAFIHGIEHCSFEDAKKAITRYYEILQPGGECLLSVPDLAACFAHYFYWGDVTLLHAMLYGSQKHEKDFHYCGFTEKSLTDLMLSCGFKNVQRWDWKTTPPFDYCDSYAAAYYPYFQSHGFKKGEDTPIGKLMSLNLRGEK
jgi:hypothetical protein